MPLLPCPWPSQSVTKGEGTALPVPPRLLVTAQVQACPRALTSPRTAVSSLVRLTQQGTLCMLSVKTGPGTASVTQSAPLEPQKLGRTQPPWVPGRTCTGSSRAQSRLRSKWPDSVRNWAQSVLATPLSRVSLISRFSLI